MARPRDDDVRRSVILATFECVAARGVDGMSIREVARLAGVSTGTISYHFVNKQQLLVEAIDYGYWKLPDSFSERPSDETMRYVLARYELTTPKRRVWWQFWLAVTVHAQSNDDVHSLLSLQHQSIVDRWTGAYERGVSDGRFVAGVDARSWAIRLAALAHGLAVSQLMGVVSAEFAHDELTAIIDGVCVTSPARP